MKLFLFIINASFISITNIKAESINPQIYFTYGYLIDGWCSHNTGYEIKDSWKKELFKIAPDLVKIWEEEGPILFGAVYEEFGKKFKRNEYSANFTLCNMPSFSNPLTLNVRAHLKSFMTDIGRPRIRPKILFADLMFHELLHSWLMDQNYWVTSKLLKNEYKNEPQRVKTHLHLMSIQILIYNKLNKTNFLKWTANFYDMIGGDYKRSWEIVNQGENYLKFIAEIYEM